MSFIPSILFSFTLIFSFNPNGSNSLVSYYEYLDSNRPEDGLPSKCDCDYKKIGLSLMSDSNYVLNHQIGRLEIIFLEKNYGSWSVNKSNDLILKVDSSNVIDKSVYKNYNKERSSDTEILILEASGTSFLYKGKTLAPRGKKLF